MPSDSSSDNVEHAAPAYGYAEQMDLRCPPFENRQDDQFFFADPAIMRRLDLLQHLTQFSDLLPVVVGARGSGKTTLLHELRRQAGDNWRIGFLEGGGARDTGALVELLADCFEMARDPDAEDQVRRLLGHWEFMGRAGQTAVLLVDDVQDMPHDVLDLLVHLAGSLRDTLAHVRMVFFGEPGVVEMIQQDILRDPKESVLLHVQEIPVFSEEQTATYLAFRLAVAGFSGESPFSAAEVRDIHQSSGGLPGRINALAHERLARDEPRTARTPPMAETESSSTAGPNRGMTPWILAAGLLVTMLVGLTLREDIVNWLTPGKHTTGSGDVVPLDIPPLAEPEPGGDGAVMLEAPKPAPLVLHEESDPGREPAPEPEPPPQPEADTGSTGMPAATEQAGVVATPLVVPSLPEPVVAGQEPAPAERLAAEPGIAMEPTPAAEPTPVIAKEAPPVAEPETGKQTATRPGKTVKMPPAAQPEAVSPPAVTAKREPEAPNRVETVKPTAPAPAGIRREAWLLAQNRDHYTIQMLAVKTESAVRAYIRKHGLADRVAYYEKARGGEPWYSLLYGVFPDRGSALAAVADMPAEIRPRQPWIRRLSSVQAEIR